jgi:hypothetical protein
MISGATAIASQLYEKYPDYRPFHDNENAGVSVLLAGAARKGYLPVSEYPVGKKAWEVIWKKRRGKTLTAKDQENLVDGRADLWFAWNDRSYSFEFKKTSERDWRLLGERGTESDLRKMLNWSIEEIDRVDECEYNHSIAGLIAPIHDFKTERIYREFSKRVPLCAVIGSKNTYKVYLYFTKKKISE